MSTADPLVDVTGLAKSFGGRRVVRDVSLKVMPGDLLGLVGANGGGKTTTLRMLAGMLSPDAGDGHVLGTDIRRTSTRTRHQIGYMAQRLVLYPDMTVSENFRFRARVFGLAQAADQIAATVARYGIGGVLDKRFGDLSGGWARRVQFAATLLHAPPLLLLDEPTAGLDVATKRDIWSWLTALAAGGHGIVISTHDLAEAERCPTIVHYHEGQANGPITPAALIAASGCDTLENAVVKLAHVTT